MKHFLWVKQADSMPQVQHRTTNYANCTKTAGTEGTTL